MKKGNIMILFGLMLIAIALLWTGRNIYLDQQATINSKDALEKLQVSIPKVSLKPVAPKDSIPEAGDVYIPPQETDIPNFVLDPTMEMPTKEIDGVAFIGYLSIPALSLELPVASQWSYSTLNLAPCRYSGSVYSDTIVIAGHNYTNHFASLHLLRQGDTLTFTDVDGNVFSYEVILSEALDADAVSEMTDSAYDLTLFTCTIGGRYRVAVRCDRAS